MRRAAAGALLLLFAALDLPAAKATPAPSRFSWAVAVWPSGREFKLEVADNPASRWRGYRDRERVGPEEGMLFVFDDEVPRSFEMRNCLVALDMIFLDGALQIVEIAHDQKPCREGDPCPPVSPMRSARYVLEVAGGIARAEGLAPGDRITILSEPPLP